MMTNKGKSKTNPLVELHFLSSLQLEQSVRVIANLADERHRVALTEISSDEFAFEIDYLPEMPGIGEIKGTLKRWNGTETKINADGQVHRIDTGETSNKSTRGIIASIFLTIFGGSFAVTSEQSWMLPFIVFGGMGIAFLSGAQGDNKNQQTVLFRHRDYLLQLLIDAFKSAGDVEAI